MGGWRLRRPGAARARAWGGRLRGGAPGGRLHARLAARRGCGGIPCASIAGGGGVRYGGPGLVRLAAAGRAPRLRRAGGGGVPDGVASVSLCTIVPLRWAAVLPRPLRYTQTEHDMANMHHVRACTPCAPRAYHCCARILGLRSVCPRCARLRARTVCTVYSCSLSSTCACSSPCLLRVPMRCVLGLCALVPFPFVYSTAYFVLFPAFGCASERCHRSRCPQLNTPATLFITHFLRSLLPLCLLCFPAALLSFLPQKKENEAAV